jgi:LPS-assembly protein
MPWWCLAQEARYETLPLRTYQTSVLWPLCTVDPLAGSVTEDTGAPDDSAIEAKADAAESSEGKAVMVGGVKLRRGDRILQADEVTLDRTRNKADAKGNVVFGDPTLAIQAERGTLNLDNNESTFYDVDYYLAEKNAQGSASRVESRPKKKKTRLRNVTYSTCARGDEIWQLRTGRLDLDHEVDRGKARNTTIAYKGVPVLYLPYLSFPISDERQSGFLTPRVGLVTNNGFDLTVPYYWNIAPNRDMTFFPRLMLNRGFLMGTEFRFLQPKHQGEVLVEYIPDDSEYGSDRGAVKASHRSSPFRRFFTNFLYEYVSDDNYIEDLDPNVDLLSPNYLERHLDATYIFRSWRVLARVQDFQTLDNDVFNPRDRPYSRLPQLLAQGGWSNNPLGLRFGLRGEGVYFDHDVKIQGARFDIKPEVVLPLKSPAGFLEPKLSYRFTGYDLNNPDPGEDTSPSRSIPIASLDGGLVFERPVTLELGNLAGIQTLEPRLFYLYVPNQNQDNIPIFDSTFLNPSYNWLFAENRFTGGDRQGDANQLTTAVTSRVLSARTGRELFRLNVGQIQYFRDRRVTLPGLPPGTNDRSVLIAESILRSIPRWSMGGSIQYSTEDLEFRRASVDVSYNRGDNARLANFSYRFAENDPVFLRREEFNQIDLSFLWPISARWRSMGRWNYSLNDDRSLDIFGGLEYRECCWAFRFLVRSNRPNPQDDPQNSIFAELELRGLANIGSSVSNVLEENIRGYQKTSY